MTGAGIPVISAAEVETYLDYPSLIDALARAFQTGCTAPLRHRYDLPGGGTADGGMMLIKPAWREDGPVVVKIVNVFPENAARGLAAVQGSVLVFDGSTGVPSALIDGQALTNRRTAAASALAARYLASPASSVHLVVGTGQLAPELAFAHAAVRPISQTLVWGRDLSKAERLAGMLTDAGRPAEAVSELSDGVRLADIVSCATLSTEPLVSGNWLKDGAHLDLVGGYRPDMREADDAAVTTCRLYVDTRDGAMSEAGDLTQPVEAGIIDVEDVLGDLAELCRGEVTGRSRAEEKTLFKSVGTALEDLAAAELVWERAVAANGT